MQVTYTLFNWANPVQSGRVPEIPLLLKDLRTSETGKLSESLSQCLKIDIQSPFGKGSGDLIERNIPKQLHQWEVEVTARYIQTAELSQIWPIGEGPDDHVFAQGPGNVRKGKPSLRLSQFLELDKGSPFGKSSAELVGRKVPGGFFASVEGASNTASHIHTAEISHTGPRRESSFDSIIAQ